ncbi:MAG: molybdopterin-dependent oxidoreductase [Actinomycetia bacterium]|nr:molybdopterin-dependent oxidoreductase [Actinomycetes bacterium]
MSPEDRFPSYPMIPTVHKGVPGAMRIRALVIMILLVSLAAGCSNSGDSKFERVEGLQPHSVDADLVFTNGGGSSTHSLGELEEIEMVRTEVYEPFVEARTTFEGPTVEAVVDHLGWGTDAEVQIVALNEYSYDIPISDLIEGDAVIATRENGGSIPLEEGGPARIIFPDWSSQGAIEDAWVWSVETIEVLNGPGD